ncbi:YbaB/EbfC family nucleoid-associated protein [Haloglycomyces albus]|uniref:YbaB/EbfC family nucleoid-associated protein n=1 Tax=Haloglycomyces albus TaxID=526067 RepID=UPI00046C9DED|nr:YbaB/EbfC family nucleoid-associated protein [Haloglycomyces albus]
MYNHTSTAADGRSLIRDLEQTQQNLRGQVEALEEFRESLRELETTESDEEGTVFVTIGDGNVITALDISPDGFRKREALGRILTVTIDRAQKRHEKSMRDNHPDRH